MTKIDLLKLQPAKHFTEEGIDLKRQKVEKKTGKRTIFLWSPELRKAVELALAARPVHISPWLFCNESGMGYVNAQTDKPEGWQSLWRRFMKRVLEETAVTEAFTDHDLRAKAGSDAPTLEHARALLSHSDSRTTQRVYRRKAEKVLPIR
jgi:integrase